MCFDVFLYRLGHDVDDFRANYPLGLGNYHHQISDFIVVKSHEKAPFTLW